MDEQIRLNVVIMKSIVTCRCLYKKLFVKRTIDSYIICSETHIMPINIIKLLTAML